MTPGHVAHLWATLPADADASPLTAPQKDHQRLQERQDLSTKRICLLQAFDALVLACSRLDWSVFQAGPASLWLGVGHGSGLSEGFTQERA